MVFGDGFKKPSQASCGGNAEERQEDVYRETDSRYDRQGSAQLKAMILLGINCGMGNHDFADTPHVGTRLENGLVGPTPVLRRESKGVVALARNRQALQEVT